MADGNRYNEESGNAWGNAGLGMLQGAVGGILGMNLGRQNANEAMERQMKLNLQGHQLQKDMWDYTNYENQRKHMEKAGLNVGLMYGQGGGGGTTAGSQSGGSASQAPTPEVMGLALQAQNAMANTELAKAQTRNINADATAKEMDNDTKKQFGQEADKIEADNRGKESLQKGQYLYSDLAESKGSDLMKTPYIKNLDNEMVLKDLERRIQQDTYKDRKEQVAENLAKTKMDIELERSQKNYTDEQKEKLWHDIWQGWTNAGFNGLGKIIDGVFKGGILKNAGKEVIKKTK